MISVIIPSWTFVRARKCVDTLEALATNSQEYKIIFGQLDYAPKKLGTLEAMAQGAKVSRGDLLMFIHDDVEMVEEGWDVKLEQHFGLYPKCGLVGLGGAKIFGAPDIYKVPYKLPQLIRYDFRSNMVEAESHGTRSTETQRVAFVDGFCLIFARYAFEAIGGWELPLRSGFPPFHSYDLWASIRIAKFGFETWLLPLKCHHSGGATSTTKEYDDFIKEKGWKSGEEVHQVGHKRCYEEGRGVLPIRT